MATLALRLDRVKGVANVISQDRIYIRDEAVAVTIDGFENGEESLAPCLQIMYGRFAVAEAMITVTPSNDGAEATATLNTNTRQLVDAFRGCVDEKMHQFQFRIFATTSQKPIATGYCSIWNFSGGSGEPSNLPSASEVLSALQETVSNHVADKENPHEVTKAQLGLGNVDNTSDADKPVSTATQTALNNLGGTLGNAITTETNQRTEADASLQQQISAHTTAISQNREEAANAVNAEARSRARGDDALREMVVFEQKRASSMEAQLANSVASESQRAIGAETQLGLDIQNLAKRFDDAIPILRGKTYQRPTAARGWYELLCEVIVALGGNIATEGIVPGTKPSEITLTAEDGTARSLSIVKNELGEYTSIVR